MKQYFRKAKENLMANYLLFGALLLIIAIASLFIPTEATIGGATLAMAVLVGNYAGPKPGWSYLMKSDNAADLYGLTQAQATKVAQFIGFKGKAVDGSVRDQLILAYDGTSDPSMTDYAALPIGTIVICPKIAIPGLYIHKAQSGTPVVGDWWFVASTKVGAVTNAKGATASVADGGTITHGLDSAPSIVLATGSVASEIITVTALAASTFTVAIKTDAGAAGTSQTIYWQAWV